MPGPKRRRVASVDLRVGAAQASLGYLLSGLGACLILLSRDLDVERGELAWLSAGFGTAVLLFGAAGPWILRAGAAALMRASAAVLAAGTALLAAAASVFTAQAGALLLGIGGAGIVLASPAMLAGPRAAPRLARATAAGMLAGVSGPVLMSLLDAAAGNGRLALLAPLPLLAWLAATSSGPDPSPPSVDDGPHKGPLAPARVARRWLCIVLAVAAEFAFHVWGAARLEDSGLGAAAASAAAAAFPLGMAAGRIALPFVASAIPVAGSGIALAIAGALTIALARGPILATAALAVGGLGIAALYPIFVARLMATPGLGPSHGPALAAIASGISVLAAPVCLHLLAAATSLSTSFLAVAAVLALLFALERRRS